MVCPSWGFLLRSARSGLRAPRHLGNRISAYSAECRSNRRVVQGIGIATIPGGIRHGVGSYAILGGIFETDSRGLSTAPGRENSVCFPSPVYGGVSPHFPDELLKPLAEVLGTEFHAKAIK